MKLDVNSEMQELKSLGVADAKIGPMVSIATMALTLAMKYHDINTVQDGTLYQQYKLEGKNFEPLTLGLVFETAMQIERHLVSSNDRIADMLVEMIVQDGADEDERSQP